MTQSLGVITPVILILTLPFVVCSDCYLHQLVADLSLRTDTLVDNDREPLIAHVASSVVDFKASVV